MGILDDYKKYYDEYGFVGHVPILSHDEITMHYKALQDAEVKLGPLHYHAKIHSLVPSAYQLSIHDNILNMVEKILGSDILLYNVTYIIKEPHTESRVSWHQDLTYWGFDKTDNQVSVWLALTDATPENGCMMMLPKSHKKGLYNHEALHEDDNILLQGQTVKNIDDSDKVYCALNAGECSLHHGHVLHSSSPNISHTRRVGINMQYITPDMKQLKADDDTALLVRGHDKYKYYKPIIPATGSITDEAIKRHAALNNHYKNTAGTS